MNSIKTIIFDYDGTLHETSHLYGEAFRYAYSYLVSKGLAIEKTYTDEETSIYLGMNAIDMWEAFMPDLDKDIKAKASGMIGQKMDELIVAGYARLYDGCIAMLDELKSEGYKLLILSNCRHAYLKEHRSYFNLDRWFSGYYAAQDYGFIPKHEIFKRLKEDYEGDYLMIGDRQSDIDAGVLNGCKTIGCTYGYGSKQELSKADYLIDNIDQINIILKNL